jgi:hypothetical protein
LYGGGDDPSGIVVFTLAWATAVKIERKGKGKEEERRVREKKGKSCGGL